MEAADEPRRTAAARKSAPGQPWSHAETMHLIDVYEEHWTKLRRGQLKAQQWEDVAAEVTRRCGPAHRKTGTQCRHKLEKLRKRYRTEDARPLDSLWPFFRRMHLLERGPLPTSVPSSFAASPPAASDDDQQEEDQDDQEEDEDEDEEDGDEDQEEEEEQLLVARNSSTRSISGLMRDAAGGFRGHHQLQQQHQHQRRPSPPAVTLSTAPPRKRVSYETTMFQSKAVAAAAESRVKAEEAPAVDRHSIAGVLRDIGEGIKQLERRRMEVQWEIERGWKETEARHNQMIHDAQRQFQDALAALPPPGKKARRDHGGSADGL